MNAGRPLPVTAFLAAGAQDATSLLRRERALREMQCTVRANLKPPLDQHCWLAGVQGRTLVLITDSPAWAARLRFQTREIIPVLAREHNVRIDQVRIRVVPAAVEPAVRTRKPPRLSARNAEMIAQVARSIGDSQLQQALQRLARRGKPG